MSNKVSQINELKTHFYSCGEMPFGTSRRAGLTDLKSLHQIDLNWNVAKVEIITLNKTLNKSEFVSHAHFDNFQSKIPSGSPSPSKVQKYLIQVMLQHKTAL